MDLNSKELRQIYSDNMKKSNALCKELAVMTGNKMWYKIADGLVGLRVKGLEISNAKSLSKQEINIGLDNYKKTLIAESNGG